jgi:NADH-quinone oxidoreductase subunit C
MTRLHVRSQVVLGSTAREIDMTDPAVLEDVTRTIAGASVSDFRGDARIVVPRETLYDLLQRLRDHHGFDMLVDITCVDYLNYRGAPRRFGMVYLLASTAKNLRITLRTFLDEPDLTLPSAVPLWPAANWLEREVWDMFGLCFAGHPDLRRILLPEPFAAHPLRKDYPLQGRGERHHFPVLRRGEG